MSALLDSLELRFVHIRFDILNGFIGKASLCGVAGYALIALFEGLPISDVA